MEYSYSNKRYKSILFISINDKTKSSEQLNDKHDHEIEIIILIVLCVEMMNNVDNYWFPGLVTGSSQLFVTIGLIDLCFALVIACATRGG